MSPEPILSAVGTYLDGEVFRRLNAAIALEPPDSDVVTCRCCKEEAYALDLCRYHYRRSLRYDDPEYKPPRVPETCQAPGCMNRGESTGLCCTHRKQLAAGRAEWLRPIAEANRLRRRRK